MFVTHGDIDISDLDAEWCPECEDDVACGAGHLYVHELCPPEQDSGSIEFKVYLYVGSTGKTVEQRFLDNFRLRDDGEPLVPASQVALMPPETLWKYNTTNTKKIRCRYLRPRHDLLSERWPNPIVWDASDPGKLERYEANLADSLRNRGWNVGGPTNKE